MAIGVNIGLYTVDYFDFCFTTYKGGFNVSCFKWL